MAFVTYDAILGGLTVRQVRSSSYDPNVTTQAVRRGGATAADQISVVKAEPQAQFTSGDLKTILNGLTSLQAGLAISSGTITIPWNQRTNGGLFQSGLNHFTLSATDGLIVPGSVSAAHGDELGASMDLQLFLLSTDGETAPVAANVNQSLASAAFTGVYEFGPVSLNGAQITKAISSEVVFGLPAFFEMYDGDHYPQYVHINAEDIEPMVRISFANLEELNSYSPLFGAMTACAVNYRKRADGGLTVADASLEHIRFALDAGTYEIENVTGDGKQTGRASILIKGKTLSVGVDVAVSL